MTILKLSEIAGFAYIKYVTKSFVTSLDLKSKTFELFLFRDLTCSSRKKCKYLLRLSSVLKTDMF